MISVKRFHPRLSNPYQQLPSGYMMKGKWEDILEGEYAYVICEQNADTAKTFTPLVHPCEYKHSYPRKWAIFVVETISNFRQR